MGYSAEDARDADFDFNRVIRLLIGRFRLRGGRMGPRIAKEWVGESC